MKKIGFIDYYLAEWHADNYPAWIEEVSKKIGLDYKVAYAWAEREDSLAYPGRSSSDWCRERGIELCATIGEVCEKADCIIILAPSHSEKHLGYAEQALVCGKPTYIDKTFAPDYEVAKKIFELSEKYNAPFFSTSALRYAEELQGLEGAEQLIITGGGSNLPEYAVHQIEMAVKLLGTNPTALKLEKQGAQRVVRVKFEGGKVATMNYSPSLPFTVTASSSDMEEYREIKSDFFLHLMADIINFFETGERSFEGEETLAAMKIRGTLISAEEKADEWLPIR